MTARSVSGIGKPLLYSAHYQSSLSGLLNKTGIISNNFERRKLPVSFSLLIVKGEQKIDFPDWPSFGAPENPNLVEQFVIQ